MKDLVLLVADKNAQFALKGALSRPQSMGIRPIEYEFIVHPGRDGGVRKNGAEMLALQRRRYRHALLILDFEGSGTGLTNAEALETDMDQRIFSQWQSAAKAIVIEPELDVWMWGGDHAVETSIEWPRNMRIREWLRDQGYQLDANGKPMRPKEAMEAALRVPRIPRSSALYEAIARKISLHRCSDPAFIRLRKQLNVWFSPENA